MSDHNKNSCSFCGRSAQEVHLIEGLDGMICADCVDLCMSLLIENGYQPQSMPGLRASVKKKSRRSMFINRKRSNAFWMNM